MVARTVPDVWSVASPESVRRARLSGAVTALRRLIGDEQEGSVAAAAEITGYCVGELALAGRAMAAAHSAAPRPGDPYGALWHDCTVLREHRGDGHIAAVNIAGLVWPEPHLLQGASVDARQQEYRGWDDRTWQQAAVRVRGRDLRAVEEMTDQLAAPAYGVLQPSDQYQLQLLLEPLARSAAGQLPYPNAMGLSPL